jgi:hypothetical protein
MYIYSRKRFRGFDRIFPMVEPADVGNGSSGKLCTLTGLALLSGFTRAKVIEKIIAGYCVVGCAVLKFTFDEGD